MNATDVSAKQLLCGEFGVALIALNCLFQVMSLDMTLEELFFRRYKIAQFTLEFDVLLNKWISEHCTASGAGDAIDVLLMRLNVLFVVCLGHIYLVAEYTCVQLFAACYLMHTWAGLNYCDNKISTVNSCVEGEIPLLSLCL